MFQPTRPHRARLDALRVCGMPRSFQPTRPHRARQPANAVLAEKRTFQPTRPHRARRHHRAGHPRFRSGFNPRARTGRDPARPAHPGGWTKFQPTRPHRARLELKTVVSVGRCFNPRARTGRDWRRARTTRKRWRFNPRARTGRDMMHAGGQQRQVMFQPTRPHRARRHLYKPAPPQPFPPHIREPAPIHPLLALPAPHPGKIPFALNHLHPREPQADKPVTRGSQRPAPRKKKREGAEGPALRAPASSAGNRTTAPPRIPSTAAFSPGRRSGPAG